MRVLCRIMVDTELAGIKTETVSEDKPKKAKRAIRRLSKED